MIVIEGTISVRELESARQHMQEMIAASRAEPGCIDYSYAVDIVDPSTIRVSERWIDRNALDQHLKSEHIAKWRAGWAELRIGERSLRLYEAEPEEF